MDKNYEMMKADPAQHFAACAEDRKSAILEAVKRNESVERTNPAYMKECSGFLSAMHDLVFLSDYRSFCIVNGAGIWKTDEFSDLSTMEWIKEKFGFDDKTAEATIRGSICKGRIVICKGSNYDPIDMHTMPERAMRFLVDWYCEKEHTHVAPVVNGVIAGKKNTVWPAIEDLGVFACSHVHTIKEFSNE